MSLLGFLMSDEVDIERDGPRVRDSTGSYVPGPPTLTHVTGCAVMSPYGVAVGSSSEVNDASHTITVRRVFFAPVGTDVRPEDRILHRGKRYQVIGTPLIFEATTLRHLEVPLQEVTG
ncbi:hypothetical protein HEK616_41000 [Streptomyces nigrescens]|uniref:Head-to-tail stopper n=2 Tax=Streptomyces nigrescens TaxID=1920 RepID=A0ABM7ZWA6_STRNI|nr:hypothetical protein HEK616_41000 [Streptomyces nigrescens]